MIETIIAGSEQPNIIKIASSVVRKNLKKITCTLDDFDFYYYIVVSTQ
jgi:hypothetical protein